MSEKPNSKVLINDAIVQDIGAAVRKLAYGTILITVHDQKISQIEIAEKKRFDDVWKVDAGGGI